MGATKMNRKVPNLTVRNGIFETRIQIPADVREAYGKGVEQVSHGTRDFIVALVAHEKIAAAVKARIAALRSAEPSALPAAAGEPTWTPDDAFAALKRWARKSIDRAYVEEFYGKAPNIFSEAAKERGRQYDALSNWRWHEIPDMRERLAAALVSEGIEVSAGDHVITSLTSAFAETWLDVLDKSAQFRAGKFDAWSLSTGGPPAAPPSAPAAELVARPSQGNAPILSALVESYLKFAGLPSKEKSELRGYMRRLIEHLGDIPASSVTTLAMDGFLDKLRSFPVTKRPDLLRMPFDKIIERLKDDQQISRLAARTIRVKWFGAYNRIFKYALSRELIVRNPVAAAMPNKKHDQPRDREPWDAAQIGRMFAKPLFAGAASLRAYRDDPGDLVAHDAKYWLPIIALWSGMRLDEPGAARADEVRQDDGVWIFDLTKRPLAGPRRVKNTQSQRIVPVHPVLIELGFLDYVGRQGEWLFADLPHDSDEAGSTTAVISKWLGHWRRTNGFQTPDRKQDHHSFRHNFKDACREAGIAEDVHDRLTGHAGSSNQQISRGYGSGWSTKFLGEAMAKVAYPSFPIDRVRRFI